MATRRHSEPNSNAQSARARQYPYCGGTEIGRNLDPAVVPGRLDRMAYCLKSGGYGPGAEQIPPADPGG